MILYHGTTGKRAKKIFKDGIIKCNVVRHYTKENSDIGYTEQGYVYLANELIFALSFAYRCNNEDKSDELYIFKFDLDDKFLEPDKDEIRIIRDDRTRKKYSNDLEYSLKELKSCRVKKDLNINDENSFFTVIKNLNDMPKLVKGVSYNLENTLKNYTSEQKNFIENIEWKKV